VLSDFHNRPPRKEKAGKAEPACAGANGKQG